MAGEFDLLEKFDAYAIPNDADMLALCGVNLALSKTDLHLALEEEAVCWTETLPMHSILKKNSCQEYRYLGTPYIFLRGSCISIHIQLYYIPISETKGVSQTLVEGN